MIRNQGPSSVRDEFTVRYGGLLTAAEGVVDPADYLPLLPEMEAILARQVVVIPLYRRPFAIAHAPEVIGGYGFDWQLNQPQVLWNVDRWYDPNQLS